MPHEGEVALFEGEFPTRGCIYVAPLRTLAEDRARFIRLCAKDSGGELSAQDVDAVVDCFGGTRAEVIAEAKTLGIPYK